MTAEAKLEDLEEAYSRGRVDYVQCSGSGFFTPPYGRAMLEYMFWRAGWESAKEEAETKIT